MPNITAFLRDERGSQTIEFIVWIPLIMMVLVTVIDAATLYLAHAEMENVARDTVRRMTTGVIGNKADAEAYATGKLSLYEYPYTVDATYDPNSSMIVNISVDVADAIPFGFLPTNVLGNTIFAQVAMRGDPSVTGSSGGSGKGGGK
ncbi:MAG TPA: TadE/TadG family type IV pilus assembly protein [Thermohalobaculum sp.]|nr:TadE/TadG family type IV pilus assembly protein [Thermohalobaculum sp.]